MASLFAFVALPFVQKTPKEFPKCEHLINFHVFMESSRPVSESPQEIHSSPLDLVSWKLFSNSDGLVEVTL